MINKKFSDLFLRKENTRKQQPKQIPSFDQNYFHCRLISQGINTELIRVQSQVKQNGQPLDQIKCKWFIKNTHDFKEIQDVTSEYYQPCLDDVGSIICVQIEPFIEGKKYNGIIIMKESEIVEIDSKLEDDLSKFLERKQIKMDGRLEAIFSQNEKYETLQLPAEIKLEIINNQIHFYENGKEFEMLKITSDYPNVEFIRKSFNSIILNFNERQSYKLGFFNNFNRDLFTLITRTLSAHCASINPEQQQEVADQPSLVKNKIQQQVQEVQLTSEEKQTSEGNVSVTEEVHSSPVKISPIEKIECKYEPKSSEKLQLHQPNLAVKEKTEEPKQNNTLLILKLDEQNKELKILRRQIDELKVNYNIEKQSKQKIETQFDQSKKSLKETKQHLEEAQATNKRLAQVSEDNRFYKNEMAILRKELKANKEKIKEMQNIIENKKAESAKEENLMLNKISSEKQDLDKEKNEALRARQEVEAEFQRLKQQFEKMENQNHQLKKKLQSLHNERSMPGPKQIPIQKAKTSNESQQKVMELEMKLKNLQMLLRYKSNQGDTASNFQILVNKLTQTISQKELQLNEFKKINKNLLQQIKKLKQKAS